MTNENETIADEPGTTDQTPVDVAGTPAADLAAIRELVLRAHPEVVPEMIGGDTVETLLASVAPAETAYQRLAETLGRTGATPAVPAGGHRPMPVDPDRLPASEKIRRGLARSSR